MPIDETNGRTLDDLRGSARPETVPSHSRVTPRPRQSDVAPEANMPEIRIGYSSLASWEFTQRVARAFSASSMVPVQYRARVKGKGKNGEWEENPAALSNCIIALNMADRLKADPLMVMQHLYIVEGRPAWSAQFVIGAINSCGRYTPLQYEMTDTGFQTIEFETEEWGDRPGEKIVQKHKITVPNLTCRAWVNDKATGARLEGPVVSMELAVREGWYLRKGSKWQTPLRDMMLRYRAASFLGRIYCPDLLMGLRTVDEEQEIIDAEQQQDGTWQVVPPEILDAEPEKPAASPAAVTHETVIHYDLGGAPDPVAAETQQAEIKQSAEQKPRGRPRKETEQRGMDLDVMPSEPADDGFGSGE